MDTPQTHRLSRDETSLVMRLVRSAFLWTVPFILISAMVILWVYRSSTLTLFDDPLDATVTSLIASADSQLGTENSEEIISLAREPLDPRYQQALSGRYWLIGQIYRDGRIVPLKGSRSMTGETLTITANNANLLFDQPGETLRARTIGPDKEPLRYAARLAFLPGLDDTPLVMIAAADSRPASRAIFRLTLVAIGLMVILILGVIVAVFMQVRIGLKPLFDLRKQVVDVREGREIRVSGHFPSEIYPLANELNGLIDHNSDVVKRARTHVSNLAHALKTPIAVLRNEAQQQTTPLSGVVRRQTESMKKQVDHHLQRARAATRGQSIGALTPVDEVLQALARTMPRIYRDKDVTVTLDIDETLVFRGEKRDLDEILGNLIDNAFKWTVDDVDITAKKSAYDETMLEVCVCDNGPGIDKEDYAEAVKRGARLDETTPGTGFGLAIVDDLARAYKGSMALSEAPKGGLCVTVTLPRRV